jgi:hypothetical protein
LDFFDKCLFFATLHRLLFTNSVLDLAMISLMKQFFFPDKNLCDVNLGFFELDLSGNLIWVATQVDLSTSDMGSFTGLGSFSSGLSSSVDAGEEVSSLNSLKLQPRPRGRPCKTDTPKVVSEVKRCTRNNKDGYVPLSLPDGPSLRKKSKVKKAQVPEVLQILEMQHIGVELCQIPPEELTEEQLRQGREE